MLRAQAVLNSRIPSPSERSHTANFYVHALAKPLYWKCAFCQADREVTFNSIPRLQYSSSDESETARLQCSHSWRNGWALTRCSCVVSTSAFLTASNKIVRVGTTWSLSSRVIKRLSDVNRFTACTACLMIMTIYIYNYTVIYNEFEIKARWRQHIHIHSVSRKQQVNTSYCNCYDRWTVYAVFNRRFKRSFACRKLPTHANR